MLEAKKHFEIQDSEHQLCLHCTALFLIDFRLVMYYRWRQVRMPLGRHAHPTAYNIAYAHKMDWRKKSQKLIYNGTARGA
jgi:hypothetical protein